MSIEETRPEKPTAQILADDLYQSNEQGLSWFTYEYGAENDTIIASLYSEDGFIEKRFSIRLSVEEL